MSPMDRINRLAALNLERLPKTLLRPLAGRRRINDRDDEYELSVQVALHAARLMGVHFTVGSVEEGRAAIRRSSRQGCRLPNPAPRTESLVLPCGLPARLYRPVDGAPRGLVVWFHGGGWVVGDLVTGDSACQWLAHRGRFAVLSVDYRLAPEHPWPVPVDDAEAAWRDALALRPEGGLEGLPAGVGGDSAGGNLSAVTSNRTRRSEASPDFQLLVYPGLDLRRQTESTSLFADDLALPARPIRRWCR